MANENGPLASGYIDWLIMRVDEEIEKHGLTTEDVKLKKFLDGRPRSYKETDPVKLQSQINGLGDTLVIVVRERDKLRHAYEKAKDALRILNLKFWILSGVVGAEGCVILFLATQLFSRLH